jgi:hypothetical protein
MTEALVHRHLSGPLLLGLLTVPLIFSWFLLRRGYSSSLRKTVLIYTTTVTLIPMIGQMNS